MLLKSLLSELRFVVDLVAVTPVSIVNINCADVDCHVHPLYSPSSKNLYEDDGGTFTVLDKLGFFWRATWVKVSDLFFFSSFSLFSHVHKFSVRQFLCSGCSWLSICSGSAFTLKKIRVHRVDCSSLHGDNGRGLHIHLLVSICSKAMIIRSGQSQQYTYSLGHNHWHLWNFST